MMRWISGRLGLALLVFACVTEPRQSFGCRCVREYGLTPDEQLAADRATVGGTPEIFLGQVIGEKALGGNPRFGGLMEFRVQTVFKGKIEKTKTLLTGPPMSCGIGLSKVGATQYVFAVPFDPANDPGALRKILSDSKESAEDPRRLRRGIQGTLARGL